MNIGFLSTLVPLDKASKRTMFGIATRAGLRYAISLMFNGQVSIAYLDRKKGLADPFRLLSKPAPNFVRVMPMLEALLVPTFPLVIDDQTSDVHPGDIVLRGSDPSVVLSSNEGNLEFSLSTGKLIKPLADHPQLGLRCRAWRVVQSAPWEPSGYVTLCEHSAQDGT